MQATKRHARRDNRRRGLRIVLWTMGFFLLAQLVGGLVLDHWWVRGRYPWQAEVYEQLQARATPPEIIFLGSSRFCGDWNCSVLDAGLRQHLGKMSPRTFNAAVPWGDTTVAERILDDVLHLGYRPKLVVLEVNPVNLASGDDWVHGHALRLLDWRDFPEAFMALIRNGRIMFLVRGRLLPLYLHRDEICQDALSKLVALFHSGRGSVSDPPIGSPALTDPPPPPPIPPDIMTMVKESCQMVSRRLVNYQPHSMAVRRLERLLDRCHTLEIPVLLVQPPVHSLYRQAVSAQANAIFADYIQRLTERYGCRYCDLSDHLPDEYFRDEHHAHPEGAIYLSRRFAPAVLAPLWRDLQHADTSSDKGSTPGVPHSF